MLFDMQRKKHTFFNTDPKHVIQSTREHMYQFFQCL